VLVIAATACAPAPESVAVSGEHDGLTLAASVTDTGHSIAVDVVVGNARDKPLLLVPDQCGRVTDVELERTELRPEGRRWDGPIQTVKEFVLDEQGFLDRPDSFAPRRVGDGSSEVPECARLETFVTLEAGGQIAERWELPVDGSFALKELGAAGTLLSLEAVEPMDPNEMQFLDMLGFEAEQAVRAGRTARAELPLSDVTERAASEPPDGPTYGELFDRLVENDELRGWIEAQPVDGWRSGDVQPPTLGATGDAARLTMRFMNTAYERAAVVHAAADGTNPVVDLPTADDRTRHFQRIPGTLPPGIAAVPDSDFTLTDDLLVGEVALPSGRAYIGEYFDETEFDFAVAPGAYPARATLARHRDQSFDNVAFATLVLSDAPTTSWEYHGAIAVDGGSTMIMSVEGRDQLSGQITDDTQAWYDFNQRVFESAVAHDYLATEYAITPETNLAFFSSGMGDGGYPVYVGKDAQGKPTRVVIDFLLLHLAWPGT
jgi:hypothetical protein